LENITDIQWADCKGSSGESDTKPRDGLCEVLTDVGQNTEDSSTNSDTEPTDGTALGNERHWTNSRRQQWMQ